MNQQLEKYLCDEFLVSCSSVPQKSHSWGSAHHFRGQRDFPRWGKSFAMFQPVTSASDSSREGIKEEKEPRALCSLFFFLPPRRLPAFVQPLTRQSRRFSSSPAELWKTQSKKEEKKKNSPGLMGTMCSSHSSLCWGCRDPGGPVAAPPRFPPAGGHRAGRGSRSALMGVPPSPCSSILVWGGQGHTQKDPPGFPKISWDGTSGGIDGDRATCRVSPQPPNLGWDTAL